MHKNSHSANLDTLIAQKYSQNESLVPLKAHNSSQNANIDPLFLLKIAQKLSHTTNLDTLIAQKCSQKTTLDTVIAHKHTQNANFIWFVFELLETQMQIINTSTSNVQFFQLLVQLLLNLLVLLQFGLGLLGLFGNLKSVILHVITVM